MKRNQSVTNEVPETKVKIVAMTAAFITVIAILHIGIWIWKLDCFYITKPGEGSLHFITFYLDEIFVSLMYSLIIIVGIGAVIIIATYRRGIYNAQKDVDAIIIKGKEA